MRDGPSLLDSSPASSRASALRRSRGADHPRVNAPCRSGSRAKALRLHQPAVGWRERKAGRQHQILHIPAHPDPDRHAAAAPKRPLSGRASCCQRFGRVGVGGTVDLYDFVTGKRTAAGCTRSSSGSLRASGPGRTCGAGAASHEQRGDKHSQHRAPRRHTRTPFLFEPQHTPRRDRRGEAYRARLTAEITNDRSAVASWCAAPDGRSQPQGAPRTMRASGEASPVRRRALSPPHRPDGGHAEVRPFGREAKSN